MNRCRILPDQASDGPGNMAIDEAMLDSVADDPSSAIFRTYTWTEPTLSLGYFQSIAAVEAELRWHAVPLVRRPTGGGALWHHHEVTYAIVIPRSHPLARRSADLYAAVHAAIAAMLRADGLDVVRRGDGVATSVAFAKPFLCFADRDAEDVVSGRVKIVGSAQRRRAGSVLQHGSLLIAASPTTPELLGLADLATLGRDPHLWADRLRAVVPKSLGLDGVPSGLTDKERRDAEAIEANVYRNPSWTRKR